VINPGNPTGAIFSDDTIKKIIEFSVRNRLVLIADEVYRQNIYK
jgi:aspartate/methionine/tyrosine aminotransferase